MKTRLLDILYCAALALYVLAGTPFIPFHGDEATQIYMSRDYAYQFIQRDLTLVRYSDPAISAQEQELRLLNGTINKYLIGAAWHSAGYGVDDINEQWDWGAGYAYNVSTGHAPSSGLLQTARLPSALLTAAGVLVIFLIGRASGGRGAAYLAAALYALNPAVLVNGRRAMMEGGLLAFTLLTVLTGVWFVREKSWRAALVLGIAAGLAVASKHTAAFAVAGVFVGCALSVDWRRTIPRLLAAGVVALVMFYILNPAWWGDPLARAAEVLTLRQDLLTGQVSAFGGYANIGEALTGFVRQAGLPAPMYYEIDVWAGYIGDQIAAYENTIWTGIPLGTASGVILLLFGVIGAAALMRRGGVVGRVIVGWGAAALVSTALLTPLEWQRYYLPIYPVLAVWASCGMVFLVRVIVRRRRLPTDAVLFSY